jgi:hypothetical protein
MARTRRECFCEVISGFPRAAFQAGDFAQKMARTGGAAMILQSIRYHFHRLDLARQGGFIVTVYDEHDLRLAETEPCRSPAEAFAQARKIVDGKVEGPKHPSQRSPAARS